jgi:hypothetical protein
MTEILGAVVRAPLVGVAEQLNTRLWGVEPWRIVAGTASVSLGKCSDVNLNPVRAGILGTGYGRKVRFLESIRSRFLPPPPKNQFHEVIDSPKQSILRNRCLGSILSSRI